MSSFLQVTTFFPGATWAFSSGPRRRGDALTLAPGLHLFWNVDLMEIA